MYAKPKKKLGQVFLFDKNIQKKIIAACNLKTSDNILEIGSGRGDLTTLIAQKATCLYALEIDEQLCDSLALKFKDNPRVKIINCNFLEFNFDNYFSTAAKKIRVIGNIPYYITTPIIERLIWGRRKIKDIFIMVQKEFGRRIAAVAGSKEFGAFSCFVQYYTHPEILFPVKNTSFYPKPKVDSYFIKLKIRNTPAVRVRDERVLFKIIRAAFNQRRKILKNSLKRIMPDNMLEAFFLRYRINPNIRPECLRLADFAKIANSCTPPVKNKTI